MKLCKRCNEVKEVSFFGVDSSKADGLTYACKACTSAYKRQYDIDKGRSKGIRQAYKQLISDKDRAQLHALEKKQQRIERMRIQRAADPEKFRERVRVYKRKNADFICSINGKRRAMKLNATVSWANDFFIQQAYEIAKLRSEVTGVKHVVDHIIPLINDSVCGLHVETNLQVIPQQLNARKSNKLNTGICGGWGTLLMAKASYPQERLMAVE